MEETIRRAIQGRHLIEVLHRGLRRVIEPYLLFEASGGNVLLHAWQVEGDYEKSPPPEWCNLWLKEMESVVFTDRTFNAPHVGYNPRNSGFHRILCSVEGE